MKFDRKGKREKWLLARRAESSYNTRLRQVAKQVGAIIKGFTTAKGEVTDQAALKAALMGYATLIGPWAKSVANYMLADVARRNAKAWRQHGEEMGVAIRAELNYAPTGFIYTQLMDEQVELIKSLPIKAAERVQYLSTEAVVNGSRAVDIMAEILRTGLVTENRARLIARTEVARAASTFTRARAEFSGSEGYIWRTSEDSDVRDTHRHMNGKYVPWNDPPKTDAGLAPYHAGCGPNCRCYPDPVLPDLDTF